VFGALLTELTKASVGSETRREFGAAMLAPAGDPGNDVECVLVTKTCR
jgi:hypothetical protein